MKKIFILPILIAPIIAHATDPVGPAHVNSGAVVATANAPYAIATPETGDTTNVVSASYVKGAYNDAISAINNVANKVSDVESDLSNLSDFVNNDIEDEIAEKQNKLVGVESQNEISNDVIEVQTFASEMESRVGSDSLTVDSFFDDKLVTAGAVGAGMLIAIHSTGVSAVTAWGNDDSATVLDFVPKN